MNHCNSCESCGTCFKQDRCIFDSQTDDITRAEYIQARIASILDLWPYGAAALFVVAVGIVARFA